MKILVVEDDLSVAQTLQLLFTGYNYAVDMAADGETGLEMADAYPYDLILLDLILPKLDGVSVCKQLRDRGFLSPILLLTGQEGGAQQKAIALNAGADDYVVKPFDTEELMARVQALLRRGSAIAQTVLTWDGLSVDPRSCQIAYHERLVSLTPKEYAILELLLRHPQQPLNSQIILDRVWTALESPGEEAVRVHIKDLRQKLAAVGAPKDLIKTRHRLGYQLNPLYASAPSSPNTNLTPTQLAELKAVNEELRSTLAELRATQAQLEQKHRELAEAYQTIERDRERLRVVAEMDAFRLRLSDALRSLIEPQEIQTTATRILGEYLQVDRVYYAEISADDLYIIVPDNYYTNDNVPNIAGQYRIEDFSPLVCGEPRSSPLVVVADTHAIATSDPAHRTVYDNIRVRALIAYPLVKAGRLVALLNVTHSEPRQWTEAEIALVEDTAERTWATLERARAEANLRELERAQAAQALQDREEMLHFVLTGVHAGYWNWDVVTGDLFWSPETYVLYGLDPDVVTIRQEDWYGTYLHPDDRAWVKTYMSQLLSEDRRNFQVEFRILQPQGGVRWVMSLGYMTVNDRGQPLRLSGINLDITERKQAEIALRESEAKFRHFAEHSRMVLWIAQPTYLAGIYVSPAYEKIWGRSYQSLIDRPESWLEAIHPEDRDRVRQQLVEQLWEDVCDVEYRIVRPDGSIRWIADKGFAIRDEGGRLYRYGGIAEDITERKQADEDLRQREAFLSSIYNGANEAIFVIDVADNDFRYAGFNRLAEEYGRVSDLDAKQKTPEEAYGNEIGAAFRQNYEHCVRVGQSISYTEEIPLAGGQFGR